MIKKLLTFLILISIFKLGHAQNWIIYNTSNSGIADDFISSIGIDTNGVKFIGTVYGGVSKFNDSNWTTYNINEIHNSKSIYIDNNNNNKWFCSGWSSTVCKFNDTLWTKYDSVNSQGTFVCCVPNNQVIGDNNGNIYVGTGPMGIKKFNGSYWSKLQYLPSQFINCLEIDSSNALIIGHWDKGLTIYKDTIIINYNTLNSSIPSNNILSIAIEKNGTIWATTDNGVAKIIGNSIQIYNSNNSILPSVPITKVVIDKENVKWFADFNGTGWGHGLVTYNDTVWSIIDTSNSEIPSNDVRAIAVDHYNNLWIGTERNGLAVYNEKGIVNNIDKYDDSYTGKIKIFPIPFSDYLNIESPNYKNEIISINIYNNLGKNVLNETKIISNKFQINTSQLTVGVYTICFTDKHETKTRYKLIKNHCN